jgi:hypothetical protein
MMIGLWRFTRADPISLVVGMVACDWLNGGGDRDFARALWCVGILHEVACVKGTA